MERKAVNTGTRNAKNIKKKKKQNDKARIVFLGIIIILGIFFIINKSIEEARENKAIVVGVPVKDTIKVIDHDNNIVDTPNRSLLWAVQTPQTFDYNLLIKSYEDAFKDNFYGTDDAMLVERIGYKVKMVEGSYNNIKITTQEDLGLGSQILKVQE